MSFIIINKAKGWWVVQRDPEGTGNIVTDSLKSGWVPAGMSSRYLVYLYLQSLILVPRQDASWKYRNP
jgi:hypothetical protein